MVLLLSNETIAPHYCTVYAEVGQHFLSLLHHTTSRNFTCHSCASAGPAKSDILFHYNLPYRIQKLESETHPLLSQTEASDTRYYTRQSLLSTIMSSELFCNYGVLCWVTPVNGRKVCVASANICDQCSVLRGETWWRKVSLVEVKRKKYSVGQEVMLM